MSKPLSIPIHVHEIAAHTLAAAPALAKPGERSERLPGPPPPAPSKFEWPRTNGRFLAIGEERFWVKGVTYGTFRANEEGEPFPSRAQVRDDFARMRDAGINA